MATENQGGKLALVIGAALTALFAITDTFSDHNVQIVVNSVINLIAKVVGILFGITLVVSDENKVAECQGAITGPVLLAATYALLDLEIYPYTHWAVVLVFTGFADEMLSAIGRVFGRVRPSRSSGRKTKQRMKKRG